MKSRIDFATLTRLGAGACFGFGVRRVIGGYLPSRLRPGCPRPPCCSFALSGLGCWIQALGEIFSSAVLGIGAGVMIGETDRSLMRVWFLLESHGDTSSRVSSDDGGCCGELRVVLPLRFLRGWWAGVRSGIRFEG